MTIKYHYATKEDVVHGIFEGSRKDFDRFCLSKWFEGCYVVVVDAILRPVNQLRSASSEGCLHPSFFLGGTFGTYTRMSM